MIIYHIILLAIIQGLTEFLPVSSSGHLGLFHCFTDHCANWDKENMAMDVSVHVGTLLAVLVYFWRDVVRMLFGLKDIGTGKTNSNDARLMLFVLVSSIPVIIAGFALHYFEPDFIKTLYVIAWMTLIFGLVLWYADSKTIATKDIEQMTYKDSALIGLAQVLALIPGVSRSGITMTAARFLGYNRSESAHFSMLMAMVAISGAGLLIGKDVLEQGSTQLGMATLIGVFFSFISGLIAIFAMMKFLQNSTFTVFAVYRVILGVVLLGLLYAGVIG
jgi:undecaprenyl-diphosphatase